MRLLHVNTFFIAAIYNRDLALTVIVAGSLQNSTVSVNIAVGDVFHR
jgi:hypothetical protein